MRSVDADKLLEELIEKKKAGEQLIAYSDYDNINSIDDAIEVVKYADEFDLCAVKVKFALRVVQEFRKLLEPFDDYVIDGGKLVGLKLGDCFDDIVNQLIGKEEQK